MPLTIYEAKAKHETDLLMIPGVTGVGVSGNRIIVYVERPDVPVPPLIEGYTVTIKVIGRVEAL